MVTLRMTVSKSGCFRIILVISHGAGLPDRIVNHENSAGNEFLRVEFVEIIHLPFFVGIQEDEVKIFASLSYLLLQLGLACCRKSSSSFLTNR
jgi:hypothetical protein